MSIHTKWKIDEGFFKDTLTLLAGTGGSQLLSVLMVPVITRLFSVENFGVMTTFSTVTLTIAVFACAGYDQAINLPKDDKQAWNLFCLCIYFNIAFYLILHILTFSFNDWITHWIFKTEKNLFVYLLPVTVFFRGIYMAMMFWMIRFRNFATLSVAGFIGVAGNQGTKLIGGYCVGDSVSFLILGTLFSNIFPCISFAARMYRQTPREIFRFPSKLGLIYVGYKYRNFPLYSTWVELLINLGRSIPVLLLASAYDNTTVGYFGLAYTILTLPISLFNVTVRQACLPRITALMNERKPVSAFLQKIIMGLSAVSIIPFTLIMIYGPDLVSFIFGSNWREAGVYARLLVPWCFTMLLVPPASVVLTVTQNQAFRLIFYSALTVFQIIIFIIPTYLKMDIHVLLTTLSLGSSAFYIGKIFFGYRRALNYRNL